MGILNNDIKVRAGLYMRVSTEDQAREGFSLPEQKERLEAYCRLNNFEIVDYYEDAGISAKKGNYRPEWERLKEDIKSKKINTMIALKQDRITRSIYDWENILSFLEEKVLGKENWRDNTILHIIENEIYKGDFIHGKMTKNPTYYENVVEPIISKELWEECQHQKRNNSRAYSRTLTYIFLQKCLCPKCRGILC